MLAKEVTQDDLVYFMLPMVRDGYIADLIATLAMLDPVLGGIDR